MLCVVCVFVRTSAKQKKNPGWVARREILPAAAAVLLAGGGPSSSTLGGTAQAAALPWSCRLANAAGPGNCSRKSANADLYETN